MKEYDVTITIMDIVDANTKEEALAVMLKMYKLRSVDIADSEIVCWEDE